MRILVLDDDPVILDLATDLLSDEGYEVTPINNPESALEAMGGDSNFDLLVTDIKMPGISGLEVIRRARQISPKTKAIIMTGYGDLQMAQVAIKEGAYDFLLKPFENEALRVAVRNALQRRNKEEEDVRLKELAGLFQFGELLTSQFGGHGLYDLILRSVLLQLKAEQGSLMLFDEKARVLKIAAAVGLEPDIVKNTRLKVGEGISGKVIEEGKPFLVANIDEHPLFGKLAHGYPDKGFMSVYVGSSDEMLSLPMLTSQHKVGVLNVRRKKDGTSFNQADLELVSVLAVQAAIAIENNRLLADLNSVYLGVMQFMVALTEAKDVYLRGHTQRVTNLCLRLGGSMGLQKEEILNLKYAAVLHDIGKLAISENILNKSGKLTREEFEVIKNHPAIGANVLRPFKFLDEARQIVLHHHERQDGKGYPDGLRGDEINLPTNIIIVADSFDAMNSDRAYRKALPRRVIYDQLLKNKGLQFDSRVVDAFLEILGKGWDCGGEAPGGQGSPKGCEEL